MSKRKAPAASAPEDVKLTADLAGFLHCPARAAHLESLEDHLSRPLVCLARFGNLSRRRKPSRRG
jgi:hypothetical protein